MKGIIYRLSSPSTDKVYIGSTTRKFSERIGNHKCDYKKYQNGKYNYVSSFDILKYKDYKFEIIEEIECETKKDLFKIEQKHIQDNNSVNIQKAYCELKGKEYNKEYYETNKDKVKKYYETNKDKIKEKNKEYYEANKDKLIEQKKEYNKEYQKQRIKCPECGKEMRRDSYFKHKKKHS